MNVTVLTIGGDPEVHATGCRDIARRRRLSNTAGCIPAWDYTFDADSVEAIATEYWCDFLDSGEMTLPEAVGYIEAGLKPCVRLPARSAS
jgi:hypothetical protein